MDLILTSMTFTFKYDGKVMCVDTLFYPRYISKSYPRTSHVTFFTLDSKCKIFSRKSVFSTFEREDGFFEGMFI